MIKELSQSIINQMTRCPHQFYLRYIKGIIIPPGVAARRGTSVHASADHDYHHKIKSGEYAPLDEVKDATRDTFVKIVKDEGVWFPKDKEPEAKTILNDNLNQALNMAEFHHAEIATKVKSLAMVEERLFTTIDGVDLPLAGTPDVVADGILRDLKTGNKRWAKGREWEEIQPVVYRLLLRDNGFGDLPAEYCILTPMKNGPKDKVACIWDDDLKICGDVRPAPVSPEYEESVMLRIKSIAKALELGNFPPAYPGSWWCSPGWCGYFSICKYVKGRIITS